MSVAVAVVASCCSSSPSSSCCSWAVRAADAADRLVRIARERAACRFGYVPWLMAAGLVLLVAGLVWLTVRRK